MYKKQLERIQREIGNFGDIIGYAVVPNYQRLISLKTADLLVSEPPEIKTDNETGAKALSALLGACNFQGILYQAAIDLSRYGDALLTVRRDVEGNGRIGIGQPLTWFPVVNPVDMQEFTEHVIAWVEELKESNTHKLHIQIHHPGRYEYRVHALANGTIGGMLQAPQTVTTRPTRVRGVSAAGHADVGQHLLGTMITWRLTASSARLWCAWADQPDPRQACGAIHAGPGERAGAGCERRVLPSRWQLFQT